MSAVKWIKITTDMFHNRKITYLRRMPNGDANIVIWLILLTLAGQCNDGGRIYLTDGEQYTTESLAWECGYDADTVKAALVLLANMHMISWEDGLTITGWEEYQNIDGMERIREQTRIRVANCRQKRAQSASVTQSNATSNATVTPCNAREEEEDKNKNKRTLSLFISPSLADVQAYCDERQNGIDAQAFIDFYSAKGWMIGSNKMKDWKAAVRTWEKRRQEKNTLTPRQYNDVNIEF